MRLIIQPDYQNVSKWAASYIASKIKAANPTEEKPFVLGLPTGSSPLGTYKYQINVDYDDGKVIKFPAGDRCDGDTELPNIQILEALDLTEVS